MTLEVEPELKTGVYKVLVVDDQPDVREALRLLLKGAGYAIETADSPNDAHAAMAYSEYDLIIADMNYTWDTTSGQEGLQFLDGLRAQRNDTPVVAMTGWSTIELAVEAIRRGACDFIPKPWDNRHFLEVVRKHAGRERELHRPIDTELAIARKVQRKLLAAPHFSAYGLEFDCASLPAGEISGDLYDFFAIDDSAIAFALGDVSGKGIGAALLVANLQATIRSHQDLARFPARLVDRVNALFFQSTRPEHFATLFFGVFEAETRTIRYVNCGHPPPVVLRANGECELLDATGVILGAFHERLFEERTISLGEGDRVVLFSDGVSEAMMGDGEENWPVGTIRMLDNKRANGLARALATAAASAREEPDDITVMDIRVR